MSGEHVPPAGVPVLLPDLGADPVRLSVWFADPGDRVYEGSADRCLRRP